MKQDDNTSMSARERWLAALQMEPVDRLPFWPKFDPTFPRTLPAPFTSMSLEQLHAWVGSDPHIWIPGIVHEMRTKTRLDTEKKGTLHRTIFHTPHGDAVYAQQFNPQTQVWRPAHYPIQNANDLAIMTAFYEDALTKLDRAVYEKSKELVAHIGQRACTAMAMGTSPFMEFLQWMAGIKRAARLIAEHPQAVAALLQAMHQIMLKRVDYTCSQSPADLLYLVETTSSSLLSPEVYRAYCLPHVAEYAAIGQKYKRLVAIHLNGNMKALLPELCTLPVTAFEALATPPMGDATLVDARAACAGVCLIGGTNSALWGRSMLEIIAELDEQFDMLPHLRGIIVTSATPMPPGIDPQKIKDVCTWVRTYPLK